MYLPIQYPISAHLRHQPLKHSQPSILILLREENPSKLPKLPSMNNPSLHHQNHQRKRLQMRMKIGCTSLKQKGIHPVVKKLLILILAFAALQAQQDPISGIQGIFITSNPKQIISEGRQDVKGIEFFELTV